MDAVTDETVTEVVAVIGSQMGKTAGPVLNTLGYFIDQEPSPMLLIEPRVEDAKNFSRTRLAAMIRDTKCLSGHVADPKSRDSGNTILQKLFPGGHLLMAGANSPANLAQWPIRVVLCDEVDRFPTSAGTEGDPVALASQRAATFRNRRKIIMVSTPTDEGASRIAAAYEETDKRLFYVPCPHCGHEQTLEWEQVRWDRGASGEHLAHTARYECIECSGRWTEGQRDLAVMEGQWRASAPFTGKAGFWLSGLASPAYTWEGLVREWLASQGDDDRLKVFTNTKLARLWRVRGEAPDWERLLDRAEDWPQGTVPDGACILTCGIDVQKDRLEARVWGWGRGMARWLVDRQVIFGDTAGRAPWDELTTFVDGTWPTESGAEMALAKTAIDSGYATDQVYVWARSMGQSSVMVIKGDVRASQAGVFVGTPKAAEISSRGKAVKAGVRVFPVNSDLGKAPLYAKLRLQRPEIDGDWPEGWVHIPKWAGSDEIRQLTAEQQVKERIKGGFFRHVWQILPGRRNEALDCAVYAHAAAHVMGLPRWKDAQWAAAEEQIGMTASVPRARPEPKLPAPAVVADQPEPKRQARRNGWLGGRTGRWL